MTQNIWGKHNSVKERERERGKERKGERRK